MPQELRCTFSCGCLEDTDCVGTNCTPVISRIVYRLVDAMFVCVVPVMSLQPSNVDESPSLNPLTNMVRSLEAVS